MPYRDDDLDDEWDDDSDLDDGADELDDDDDTVPCPFCRRPIFDGTPRCPSCERYLSEADFARTAKPLWVIVTAVVCLVVAIWLAFAF